MKKEKNQKQENAEKVVEEKNGEELIGEFATISESVADISLLKAQIKDLEDRLVRNNAEVINFKRRRDEEMGRMLRYANEDIVLELLPIIDNFERAINMDDDNLEDEVSKFLNGFKIIYNNLVSLLEKFEVVALNPIDEEFDPNYHQAVLTDTTEDKEDNIVLEVLSKGYMLKDKVIRPAMVKVNKK